MVIKPDNYFWLNNGVLLRDIHELSHALKIMEDSTFNHHVNSERNDFYNWTKDILEDSALSRKLLNCKTKEEMSRAIEKRIEQISKFKNKKESKKDTIKRLMEAHNALG